MIFLKNDHYRFLLFWKSGFTVEVIKNIFFSKKTTNFFPIFHFFPAELWGVNMCKLGLFW